MTRALLCLLLVGCFDGGWRDIGDGPSPPEGSWYATGVVSFVGGPGVAELSARGAELLAGSLGTTVEVPIDATPISGAGVVSAEASLQLRPEGLEVLPAGEADVLRLLMRFHPVTARLSLGGGGEGCDLLVSAPGPQLEVVMEARRDVAGHVSLVAREDGVLPHVEGLELVAPDGCPGMTRGLTGAGEVKAVVRTAIEAVLSDRTGVVARVEGLGRRLVGAGAPGRLTSGADSGVVRLVVAPNSTDGEEPILQGADGALVLPLRVGLDATAALCAADLPPVPAPAAATPTPVLDFAAHSAHVALVVRLDLVQAAAHAFAYSGGLCLRPGSASAPLTLGDIRPHLPVADVPLDDHTPVAVRFRPTSAPAVSLGAGMEPAVRVTVGTAELEIYVRLWEVDYRLWAGSITELEASGRLALDAHGTLRLTDAHWSAAGAQGAGLAEVVRRAFGASAGGLPLLPLPQSFPYPLGDAQFERVGDRLVIYARFRDDAPVRGEVSGAVGPPAAPGCSAAPGRRAATGLLFPVLTLLVLAMLRSEPRTRHGGHPHPK